MTRALKIASLSSLIMLSVLNASSQPVWVVGTPSVENTGTFSITLNYGINQTGTVYIIVYNFNNTDNLSSSTVRIRALFGPGGNLVETAVLSVRRADIGKTLQVVLNVNDPDQIHTVYIVAADSRRRLQNSPVRLNATTLPCPQADAGSGGDECDRNFALNAIPKVGSGVWSMVSGPGTASFSPNANAPDAIVTVTIYGSYVFRWTETQGQCRSSDEITVNFFRSPVADAGSGGFACDLDFVLSAVTGSSEERGTWSMTGGSGTATFSPDAHSPTATVTVSEYGRKVFTWTVVNGPCISSSEVIVDFYQQPDANAGPGANNCGLEYYLSAVPSIGTGTWTVVNGPGPANFSPGNHDPDAKVTVRTYGTYVFRWTEVNGPCTNSSLVTVGFFEQISANAGNGGHECDRNFQLNAVPVNDTGTWTKLNGPGNATFTPDANRHDAVVTVTQFGEYDFVWTENNYSCTSSDIIRVVFHDAPEVYAGPDDAVCEGSSIKLQGEGTGTLLWSPAELLNNPSLPDPVATPLATTIFTLTLTDEWGCVNSDQATIEVREQPVADAGPDQILNFLFETEMDASSLRDYESGEWILLEGTGVFSDKYSNITSVSELSFGENSFVWILSNGVCPVSADTVMIMVNDLILPTLITPNMDGRNDYFVIKGIETLGVTGLNVFNRWGASVYSIDNYKNDWDGNDHSGNLLPEDTYFYVIKPEKLKPIKGYIVIRR